MVVINAAPPITGSDIRAKLAEFEAGFGMSSSEFIARYRAGELRETPIFLEWESVLHAYYVVVGEPI